MKYKAYEVCSGTGCTEIVEVSRHTKDKLYCDKCAKKQKRTLKKK